jgi:hypothetical protein
MTTEWLDLEALKVGPVLAKMPSHFIVKKGIRDELTRQSSDYQSLSLCSAQWIDK